MTDDHTGPIRLDQPLLADPVDQPGGDSRASDINLLEFDDEMDNLAEHLDALRDAEESKTGAAARHGKRRLTVEE